MNYHDRALIISRSIILYITSCSVIGLVFFPLDWIAHELITPAQSKKYISMSHKTYRLNKYTPDLHKAAKLPLPTKGARIRKEIGMTTHFNFYIHIFIPIWGFFDTANYFSGSNKLKSL